MNALVTFTHDFEGEPLLTLTYDGRPAWIARAIGRRLGYFGGGKRLVSRIRREWADEFIEGTDYVVLTGDELAALKATLGPAVAEVPARTSGIMLLFEPGIHLVLAKTDKPVGKRLRRFLVDEVLPQIARTGEYRAERPGPTGIMLVPVPAGPRSRTERREARMARQALTRQRWVDLCDRRFKVTALHRVVDRYQGTPAMPDEIALGLEVLAAEIALGAPVAAMDPDLERWRSAMQAFADEVLRRAVPPSQDAA